MAYQSVFKRYEIKYLLTQEQKERVLQYMQPHMALDKYGRTTIRNIYLDTDTYRLIRHSIERPPFKEKMRVRSYDRATPDSPVFVELKRKYASVVYKRRLAMAESQAFKWIGSDDRSTDTQIAREIDYFIRYYGTLHPVVFLAYEREAYYCKLGSDFRITFDDNILCRQNDLSLESDVYGTPILPAGKVLMEIKCSGGIPLWMTDFLSKEKIYKSSFSKYGIAYETLIYPKIKGDYLYA